MRVVMKILIVEDNFVCRNLLLNMMCRYGECHVAINGQEAVDAFKDSIDEEYDLICLDIKMPVKSGMEALKEIREYELRKELKSFKYVKIIMTTILDDDKNIIGAFKEQCDGYLVKPISSDKVTELLTSLELI
ncbi:MAG: response regulator [Planctomycetota bacterium]|nr:MAG: response regulator [Planctomycetota bacterium]